MRYFLLLLSLYLFSIQAFSQLNITPTALNFGDLEPDQVSNKVIEIRNIGTQSINVTSIQSLHPDFQVGLSDLYLNPGETKQVNVVFRPKQNIRYNSELILICDLAPLSYRVDLTGEGHLANSYYASTFDLWNEELKSELKRILSRNYNSLGYTSARDAMYSDIDNTDGWVRCAYTGRSAQFNTRSGANSNQFNCEHTWPQSMFSQNEPERSDIHHLFPTDVTANNKRSNYPFGEISGFPDWSEGGSQLSNQVFEPRDEQKGATARAMFYFVTRYTNYNNFINDQEEILRTWHLNHPPAQWEIDRNNAIYQRQNNRNPFCDFPGFIDRIPSFSTTVPLKKEAVLEFSHRQFIIPADNKVYRIVISNSGNEDTRVSWQRNNSNDLEILSSSELNINAGESVFFELRLPEGGSDFSTRITFSYGNNSTEELIIKTDDVNSSKSFEDRLKDRYHWLPSSSTLRLNEAFLPNDSSMIYDINGKQWPLTEFKSALNEWDFSPMPSGLYFVCEIQNGQKGCFRILKH
jgi:endonuclease I